MNVDGSVAIRAAVLQGASVAALSILLAVALPKSFFEDWGWLGRPGCLDALRAADRVGAGAPARPGAARRGARRAAEPGRRLAGVHWLGAVIAIALFAIWCGRLPSRGPAPMPV